MTRNAGLATAAAVALLSSLTIMILLHTYGPQPSFMLQSVSHGMHPMAAMRNGMGWMMVLGPVAMLLFFGGILTIAILLVRPLFEEKKLDDDERNICRLDRMK